MQTDLVVVVDVFADDSASLIGIRRIETANRIDLDRSMPPLDLAVGLGVKRRSPNVCHACFADERFEVLGDEGGSIVRDHPRILPWKTLQR